MTKTFEQHLASLPENERKTILANRAEYLRGHRDRLATHERVCKEQMTGYRDSDSLGHGGQR